jgi:hypothetical protein
MKILSADYQQPFWERTLEEKWEFSTDLSNYERQETEGDFTYFLLFHIDSLDANDDISSALTRP